MDRKMNPRYSIAALFVGCLLGSCRPEMPATSTITIDLNRPSEAVDLDLYGVTADEADTASWSADMIINGSFETVDSIVGWRPLTRTAALTIDARVPLSETNPHSLLVRGATAAELMRGNGLARSERYDLTCYLHGTAGCTLTVTLRDSAAGRALSEPLRMTLPDGWTEVKHTFTATDSARRATLVFETDSAAGFGLDMVSLFPRKTWRERPSGLRADLIEAITELHPRFIRFSGRMPANDGTRHVTTREYTQLCRDLNVRPAMITQTATAAPRYIMRPDLMMAHSDLFTSDSTGRYATSAAYTDAFGTYPTADGGTLQAALGEAAFLIGVERRPGAVRGLSYTPLVGGLLLLEAGRMVRTPSYYVWQMFADHRGRRLLYTNVATARKPLLTQGSASIAVIGDAFAVESTDTIRRAGGETGNCTLATRLLRKLNGMPGAVRLLVRDNGLHGARRDAIALELTDSTACLIHLAGTLERVLAGPVAISPTAGWFEAKVECADEAIRGYINKAKVLEASAPSRPSIVAVATSDPGSRTIILKVVNTTQHDERTALRVDGARIGSSAHAISLSGLPTARNTPDHPTAIVPVIRNVRLSYWPTIYVFPANSVTVLTLKMK